MAEKEKEFKQLVAQYVKTFNRCLPVFMMPRGSDYIAIMRKCLKEGKPYVPDIVEGRTY